MNRSLPLVLAVSIATTLQAVEVPFYVGTYTKPNGSKGIYHGTLDTEKGTASIKGLAGEVKNPSFVAIHPDKKHLYAAVEDGGGAVAAFSINPDGTLKLLNSESSKGKGNCHVWVDSTGRNVLAANYGDGVIASLPIKTDGSVAPASASIQQKGGGPNKGRQAGPHAHAIYHFGDFVYACDLGTDDVFVYRFDPAKGTLTPNDPVSGRVPAGGGPRHLAIRPDGKAAFCNNEMTSAVTAFSLDAKKGVLSPLHTLSTLPENYEGAAKNSTAEIHCHPNGKFVYVSNRGHNSLAVYAIGADGKLSLIQHVLDVPAVPRGFGLSEDGRWLVCAGQKSGTLNAYRIDPASGKLTDTKQSVVAGSSCCIVFAR